MTTLLPLAQSDWRSSDGRDAGGTPDSAWLALEAVEADRNWQSEEPAARGWRFVLAHIPWTLFDRLVFEAASPTTLSVRVGALWDRPPSVETTEVVRWGLRDALSIAFPGRRFRQASGERGLEPTDAAELVAVESFCDGWYGVAPSRPPCDTRYLLMGLVQAREPISLRILVRPVVSTHLENDHLAAQAAVRGHTPMSERPGFEARIVLGAEGFLDPATLSVAASHFGGNGAGLQVFRPLTAADRKRAIGAWRGTDAGPWAPTLAPMGLERVRYLVTAEALAGLLRLPGASDCPLPGVRLELARTLAPVRPPSRRGVRLGSTVAHTPVSLTQEDRLRHLYVIGQTGTGKSTLLEHLARQDLEDGRSVVVIDPHGDLAESLLGGVPKERVDQVVYFDAGDAERPVGLNLFDAQGPEEREYVLQDLPEIFYRLFDPNRTGMIGPIWEHNVRCAAMTLLADQERPATLYDVPRLFIDAEFRKAHTASLSDPVLQDFWKEYELTTDFHRSENLGYLVAKFDRFRTNPILRGIVCQARTPYSLREVMDEGRIFIANLSVGRIGQVNAAMLGMFLVLKFQAGAMGRASLPANARRDVSLFVDEFQMFTTASFADVLAGARKYGVAATLANQYVAQLNHESRDAALGTVGSLVAFRCGPEDAGILAPRLAPLFDRTDLMYLPNFRAVASLLADGEPIPPFTLVGPPPIPFSAERAGWVKQASRERYGRRRGDAEEEHRCTS